MPKIAFFLILLSFNSFGAITVDGDLSESEWQQAQSYTQMQVVIPYTLEKPKNKTEALITSTENGIYFGFKNYQSVESRNTDSSARDQRIGSDKIELMIDFDTNAITAYSFQLGGSGSIRDGVFSSNSGFSNEWDGNWQGAVSSNDEYWSAEFYIPWDVVSMKASDGDNRKLNWYVIRSLPNESQSYANVATAETRQRFLNDFATVEIKDYAHSSLQLFPYITARQDILNHDTTADVGMDVFWKSGNGKQLSATLNPDFGQIESDNLVVNFSATETFFNERRPFFTENQSLFNLIGTFGLRLIHTRRIGSRPDTGEGLATDIDAAVKFTDNRDNYTYGFFAASEASGQDYDGRDYLAGRFIHKTNTQTLGFTATFVDRPDIDRNAQTLSFNHEYLWSDNIIQKTQIVNSNIKQGNDTIQDWGVWTSFEHQLSENQQHFLILAHYGDEFEVNDFGFLPRNNLNAAFYSHSLKRTNFSESSKVQQRELLFNAEYFGNDHGDTTGPSLTFNDNWQFKDASSIGWDVKYYFKAVDDLISRGNGKLNFDDGYRFGINYRSNNASKLRYHGFLRRINRFGLGTEYATHIHPSYFFKDNYSLSLSIFYQQGNDWLNWQEDNLFARYERDLLNTSLDFNANFSQKQELRFRLQWLAIDAQANAQYQLDVNGNLSTTSNVVNDFSLSNTALQVRYRYEVAPLSNLYVVYSRGASVFDEASENVFGSFNSGFNNVNSDNFLIKFRYKFDI